jgi:hypothetical protein
MKSKESSSTEKGYTPTENSWWCSRERRRTHLEDAIKLEVKSIALEKEDELILRMLLSLR